MGAAGYSTESDWLQNIYAMIVRRIAPNPTRVSTPVGVRALTMEAKDGGKVRRNPSTIRNKMKRQQVYAKLKSAKKKERRNRREENKRKGEGGEQS